MTQSHKLPQILLILILAVLIVTGLSSCGTAEVTSAPQATPSPSAITTDTPEPTTPTPEPEANQDAEGLILPSATPEPTVTPGPVAEMVSEFTEATGLEEVTVFRVRVEDWLNLGLSILQVFVIGFLLSRLVYYGLVRAAAKTGGKYDDVFIEKIRSQIFLISVTFGFQVGTVRLSLLEAVFKLRISRLYSAIYVAAAIVILWRLVDVLVEWYQNEVEPKKSDPHQVDTLLLLLHRFARVLLIAIAAITLLSLYNINVNAPSSPRSGLAVWRSPWRVRIPSRTSSAGS